LFSYRAAVPPVEQQAREQQAGRMVYGLADLVEQAGELRLFSQFGGLDETTEREFVERMKARRAQGWAADTATPPPPRPKSRKAADSGVPTAHGKPNGSEPLPVLDAPGPGFDESEEAKLRRRHGSVTSEQWHW
jgi:hypothetical protein